MLLRQIPRPTAEGTPLSLQLMAYSIILSHEGLVIGRFICPQ